jgi:hypothetical protein
MPLPSRQHARKLEDWLEIQPLRFVMLGISADSYNVVMWATSQFSRPMNKWWLNRKRQASTPQTFESLVTEIRRTSLIANIRYDVRDDAINAMLGLTQGYI